MTVKYIAIHVFIILGLCVNWRTILAQVTTGNLSCYQCLESFYKRIWYPYTDCQRNPTKLHQRQCGYSDRYCMVERVEWKGFVISMERGCTDMCYWGCRYEGFGFTKLHCTSCCTEDGCNTDNAANKLNQISQFHKLHIGVQFSFAIWLIYNTS